MTLRLAGEADDLELVLVLSGGNALGAFQAGFYEGLCICGLEPDWMIGTSIGAINGALIAGSASGDPLASLDRFWRIPAQSVDPWGFGTSVWQRTFGANCTTTFAGREFSASRRAVLPTWRFTTPATSSERLSVRWISIA